jgi:hypothetical protein
MHRMRRSMLVKSRWSLMAFFTAVLLVSLNSASAGGKDPLSPGPVRPGNLDYRTELPQGYLKVYSVSDEFNNGAYYAHSSYAIYSTDGKLFKRVENNISRTNDLGRLRFPLGRTRSLVGRREPEKSAFTLSSRLASGRLSIWTSRNRRHTDGGSRTVSA